MSRSGHRLRRGSSPTVKEGFSRQLGRIGTPRTPMSLPSSLISFPISYFQVSEDSSASCVASASIASGAVARLLRWARHRHSQIRRILPSCLEKPSLTVGLLPRRNLWPLRLINHHSRVHSPLLVAPAGWLLATHSSRQLVPSLSTNPLSEVPAPHGRWLLRLVKRSRR